MNSKGQIKKKPKFQQSEFAGNAIAVKESVGDTGGYENEHSIYD